MDQVVQATCATTCKSIRFRDPTRVELPGGPKFVLVFTENHAADTEFTPAAAKLIRQRVRYWQYQGSGKRDQGLILRA